MSISRHLSLYAVELNLNLFASETGSNIVNNKANRLVLVHIEETAYVMKSV